MQLLGNLLRKGYLSWLISTSLICIGSTWLLAVGWKLLNPFGGISCASSIPAKLCKQWRTQTFGFRRPCFSEGRCSVKKSVVCALTFRGGCLLRRVLQTDCHEWQTCEQASLSPHSQLVTQFCCFPMLQFF